MGCNFYIIIIIIIIIIFVFIHRKSYIAGIIQDELMHRTINNEVKVQFMQSLSASHKQPT